MENYFSISTPVWNSALPNINTAFSFILIRLLFKCHVIRDAFPDHHISPILFNSFIAFSSDVVLHMNLMLYYLFPSLK